MKRLLLVTLLAFTACRDVTVPPPPAAPGAGSFQGTIVHAEPGQSALRPAIGASVELVGSGVRTTAQGETAAFNLTPVDSNVGRVLIGYDVDGDGRFDEQKLVELAGLGTGRGRNITVGQIVLGANGAVRGRVFRSDVMGTAGHGGTSILVPEGPYFGFTGDDGSFLLENLPEGRLTIAFFRAGYAAAAQTIELRAGEVFDLQTVSLEPIAPSSTAEVRGRVLLPDGSGASQVAVSLSSGASTSTDGDGRYTFAAIPYEVYSVGFTKAEYLSAALRNVIVASPVVTLRDVTLAPGTSTPPDLDAGRPTYDAGTPVDAGPGDAGPGDAGPGDAGPGDAGPGDAGPGDAGPGDAGPGDAGPGDAGSGDAGAGDAGIDAGPLPIAVIDAPSYVVPNANFSLVGQRSTGAAPLAFTWSQDAGPTVTFANNGTSIAATPMIRAPATPTLFKFSLVVTDASNRSSTPASVVVPVAVPPVAVISPGFPAVVYASQRIVLSGAASSDPNGSGISAWNWTVAPLSIVATPLPGGSLQLDMPATVGTAVIVSVQLTVTNGLTLVSTPVSVTFQLSNAAAPSWSLDAGPSQSVAGGSTVTLNGLATSPIPGATFTYQWSPSQEPDSGTADWQLTNANAASTTFVAPRVDGPIPRTINFTLTATDTSGVLTPSQRSAQMVVNVIDRRPPQVVATSIVAGVNSPYSGWVLFDENIDPTTIGSVTVTPLLGSPNSGITQASVDGPRLSFSLRAPAAPGFLYNLTIGGVNDRALVPPNQMVTLAPIQFLAQARWSLAWESASTSMGEPRPGIAVRRPSPTGPVQAFVFGRKENASWFALPINPFSCTVAPCVLADDPSAPQAPLSGPGVRGKRGLIVNGTPVATLQHADLQGSPASAFQYGTSWQPLAPQAPGPMFTSGNGLFSVYADDGGLRAAVLDGGTWALQGTISTDTTEFSVDSMSDPISFGSTPVAPGFLVMGRGSKSGAVRAYSATAPNLWSASGVVGTLADPVIDARAVLSGNGYGLGVVLRQSGAIQAFCHGAGSCGLNTWLSGVSSFDITGGAPVSLLVTSIAGQIELWNVVNAQAVPVRLAGPSGATFSLNNNTSCTADRPELFVFEGSLYIAWQERCGAGPWRVYLRVAE